ncbi:unnamed protein product, partial [Brugia pahangi]|uniref:Secreted protein n=1 Tax=Brugia pahangi TaxID=6280 RepID=A0A0N4TNY0_BRUPA
TYTHTHTYNFTTNLRATGFIHIPHRLHPPTHAYTVTTAVVAVAATAAMTATAAARAVLGAFQVSRRLAATRKTWNEWDTCYHPLSPPLITTPPPLNVAE